MIEINGSYGEGGGQILRTSLAMSTILDKPFRLFNIRKNRSKPGLSYQHLKSIEILQEITDAEVKGAELRSKEIIFKPQNINYGEFKVDIGTAGSVTLLLQTIIPILTRIKDEIKVSVVGGTDVKWSPSIDYFNYVFLNTLKKFGLNAEVEVKKRGYYPKGGGKVVLIGSPSSLSPIMLEKLEEIEKVKGISHCGNLPEHVARRQKKSAEKNLDFPTSIKTEVVNSLSPGSGVTLWLEGSNNSIGSISLGERGKPAERVGSESVSRLLSQIKLGGPAVDKYSGDQLIPYVSLFGGEIEVSEITNHFLTNIEIVRRFVDVDFSFSGEEGKSGKFHVLK